MPRGIARGIDRTVIIAAAFDVLADAGLNGLTVRAVAARLDVRAPALYWHVRNKRELLDEMSTELMRRILAEAEPDGDWRNGLRTFAQAMQRTLLGVRDGAQVFGGAALTDDTLLRGQQDRLAAFLKQGFDVHRAVLAWRLVYDFTLGYCIEEQDIRQDRERYAVHTRDERVDADAHPVAAQVGRELFTDRGAAFGEMLDAALGAAAALRTGAPVVRAAHKGV